MRQHTEVVLVHGLWHQPEHFDRLASILRAHGVTVHVPRLHRGSLAADTAAVQEVVDACRVPPVVLGHSYGGSVITGLERVRHLIYVAAFVPAAGESGALLGGAGALVNRAVLNNGDGTTSIQAECARALLYADCTEADSKWATALLVPQQPGHGRGVPSHIAWESIESTYISCRHDKALDPALQERMAERCTTMISLESSHSPFISRPAELAATILGLQKRHDGSGPRRRIMKMSRVVFMCGPAGAGKSTIARQLESAGMTRLSFDEEAWQKGLRTMPLAAETQREIETALQARLVTLVESSQDVVLDFSFWSLRMREEYRRLLRPLGIEPETIYLATPREVILARLRDRAALHRDDFALSEELAAQYYDHFEAPSEDEGPLEVITVS